MVQYNGHIASSRVSLTEARVRPAFVIQKENQIIHRAESGIPVIRWNGQLPGNPIPSAVLTRITVMPEVTGMERCFSVTPLLVEAKALLTGGQMPGKRLI